MPSLVIYDWSLYTTSLTPSELESSTHGNDPGQTGSNAYNPSAPTWTGIDFTFNGGSGDVIDINDDDDFFQDGYVETGGSQTLASDVTINGTTYLAGSNVQNEFSLIDSLGLEVWVVRIDGVNVGFAYPEGTPPTSGSVFNANDTRDGAAADSLDQTTPSEEAYADMACFTSGTLIRTAQGDVPVDRLRVGDRVMTLDNGLQPILWIGNRSLNRQEFSRYPHLKPVIIPMGVLGNNAQLAVSPQHSILLGSKQGLSAPALVRAKHLAELPGPVRVAHGRKRATYYHMLFAQHEVVMSAGTWSESFYPGPLGLAALEPADRHAVIALLPGLEQHSAQIVYGATARPVLKRKDVKRRVELRRAKNPARWRPISAGLAPVGPRLALLAR